MIDLSGKKALVTGGGRGIGKEIALTLAKAGADVSICDIDLDTATDSAKDIAALGVKSFAYKADVSNEADIKKLFSDFISDLGQIDILVNNAGITRDGLLVRMKASDWDMVLNINLKSAFLCSREVARPMMKARGGKIINIASVVGIMGNAGQANYSASKAGLIGLTKTMARELASRSINVNAVAPGFIKTAMTDKMQESEKETLSSRIPMRKLGAPKDIANAVTFLASDMAEYVTGQVLVVDGGIAM